ncbi:MAG: TlpA family protein disulfide reductase [Anaerovoracaceae bacterium]
MSKIMKLCVIILGMVLFFAAMQWVNQWARDAQDTAAVSVMDHVVNAAPEFTVYDAEGQPVSLSDFTDRPIVLHFWASWNEQCREDLQAFEAAYQEYGQQVEFLMINITDGSKETQETASAFLDRIPYSFPVYFDLDKSAYEAIPVRSIPSTYYIDRDFQMVARATGGTNTEETLEEGLQMLLEDAS